VILEPFMQPTTVFFRDDDVGPRSPALRAVAELLLEEAIPCNYQIVPALLDAWTADFLRSARAAHAGMVELNQHGHRHRRGETEDWAEFGRGASFETQRADIVAGRARLAELLKEDFGAAVFTPPCHAYDSGTLRALQSIGVGILSAGLHTDLAARAFYAVGRLLHRRSLIGRPVSYHGGPIPGAGLTEVSVAIDVDEDTNARGRRVVKSLAALEREFAQARRHTSIVGVMLHHESDPGPRRLETLREFIRWLKRDASVSFQTIEAIASSLGAGLSRGADVLAEPAGVV
jgi:hypothetical protein